MRLRFCHTILCEYTELMIETYFTPESIDLQENTKTGALSVLPTDASLEANFGHLSPDEIIDLEIKLSQKARIAQLQIEALYHVRDNGGEMLGWLACYRFALGESDEF